MLKMARFGFLFLSSLFTFQTWAAQVPCIAGPVVLGNFLASDILSDADFKKAVACAVNHGGGDVIGESSFRVIYNLRIDDTDLNKIQILGRHSPSEPLFNMKNLMTIKFQGLYENRLTTRVRCEAEVEYQMIPTKHVVVTLKDCLANAFGNSPRYPLTATAAYAAVKK